MPLPQLVDGGGVVVGQRPPTRTLTKTIFHTERSFFTTEWDLFEIMDLTVEAHHNPQVPIIDICLKKWLKSIDISDLDDDIPNDKELKQALD